MLLKQWRIEAPNIASPGMQIAKSLILHCLQYAYIMNNNDDVKMCSKCRCDAVFKIASPEMHNDK